MSREIKLGDRVRAKNTLHRVAGQRLMKHWRRAESTEYAKVWEPRPIPQSVEGVIVGKRTLNQGFNEWGGYDEPTIFIITGHLEVVLVAYNLRRKPVPVLLEDLEWLEDEELS